MGLWFVRRVSVLARLVLAVVALWLGATRVRAGEPALEIALNTSDLTVGAIPIGGIYETFWDEPGTYQITNAGTTPVRIFLSVEAAEPAGWLPAETAGVDRFRMAFAPAEGRPAPVYHTLSSEPAVLCPRLEPDTFLHFDLLFQAPDNADADTRPQTLRLNVTALPLESGEANGGPSP